MERTRLARHFELLKSFFGRAKLKGAALTFEKSWKKIFFFDLKNSGKFQNGKNLTFFGTYIKYGLRWNEGQDFSHL